MKDLPEEREDCLVTRLEKNLQALLINLQWR